MSGAYYFPLRLATSYALDFSSVAASTSSVFGTQTRVVRLAATSPVHVAISEAPTADSTFPLLHVNTDLMVHVTPGQKVSAVKASGGSVSSADGRLSIVELT
jgi:hypothetical protein